MTNSDYSPPMERLLQYVGRKRLAEYDRHGMHPDIVRREGQRWLRGQIMAITLAGLAAGGTVLIGHELGSSWHQSQAMYAEIREQRQNAVGDCIKSLVTHALEASEPPESSNDPLAHCQRQVTAQDAYIHSLAFPPSSGPVYAQP
ncbi:MAG TPA: hypothetical protein VM124_01000 [Candidatus Limnocylindrales bacterium]|nr:hypothetical protein [Candidatus Limnocylindrales bacterium]